MEFDLAFHSSQKRVRKTPHTRGTESPQMRNETDKTQHRVYPRPRQGRQSSPASKDTKATFRPLIPFSYISTQVSLSFTAVLYLLMILLCCISTQLFPNSVLYFLYSILYSIVCQCIILTQSSAIHDFYSFALFFSLFLYPFLLLLCLSKPPNSPGLYLGI